MNFKDYFKYNLIPIQKSCLRQRPTIQKTPNGLEVTLDEGHSIKTYTVKADSVTVSRRGPDPFAVR